MVEKQEGNPSTPKPKATAVCDNKPHPFIKFVYKTTMQLLLIIIIGGLSLFLFSTIARLSCKTETSVKIFAVFSNVVWIGVGSIFPFVYVIITGKFKEGVLWCWFLGWSIMLYISGLLPALLIWPKTRIKTYHN